MPVKNYGFATNANLDVQYQISMTGLGKRLQGSRGYRMYYLWSISIVAIMLLVAAYFWRPRLKTPARGVRLVQAKRRFHVQREWLEAKFIQLAGAHATPDAPRWTDCTFADDVSYVRNRSTGELSAFVAVTITSEESEHSSHSTVEEAGNLQAGTAVFRFDRDHWETDGRAILNLNPSEAVRHYGEDFEIIGEELAHHS
jgi:hypothetical protein